MGTLRDAQRLAREWDSAVFRHETAVAEAEITRVAKNRAIETFIDYLLHELGFPGKNRYTNYDEVKSWILTLALGEKE